jgi:hypothetical protein
MGPGYARGAPALLPVAPPERISLTEVARQQSESRQAAILDRRPQVARCASFFEGCTPSVRPVGAGRQGRSCSDRLHDGSS